MAEPSQTFGDYDTAALLTGGVPVASSPLLRLWHGGYLQLWQNLRSARVGSCRRPCAGHYALLASWRWADAATARAVAAQIRRSLSSTPDGLRTRLGSARAVTAEGRVATIALAPARLRRTRS